MGIFLPVARPYQICWQIVARCQFLLSVFGIGSLDKPVPIYNFPEYIPTICMAPGGIIMAKLAIQDLDLKGKKVFVRVDFNVPIKDAKVVDDLRIREALPTIRYGIEQGAVVVLASHLGRPKGKPKLEFSLAPIAARLAELLGKPVTFVGDCIGPEVEKAVAIAKPGDVILLENLRFYPDEEANNPEFSRKLAANTPVYINDAFGSAHRAHASTEGITHFVQQAAAGFLMEKELKYLGGALESPQHPFVAILGGAKISDKIEVIENLLGKVDRLLIGGAMMFTFLKSQGKNIGKSLCEEDKLDLARGLLEKAKATIVLPSDAIASSGIEDAAGAHVVPAGMIPDAEMGLDIGPETAAAYAEIIRSAKTIIWNGPMGVFEKEAFASGTMGMAKAVANSSAVSIIGGGDSAAAVAKAGVADKITHVSTGGGASLEFLSGQILPGVAALNDK
jgi:phosphoglycerate kinase